MVSGYIRLELSPRLTKSLNIFDLSHKSHSLPRLHPAICVRRRLAGGAPELDSDYRSGTSKMNSLDFKKHWWSSAWFPPILRPDYTWQRPIRGPIATTTPPTPPVTGRFMRLFWGHVHRALFRFSGLYCRILGVRRDPVIVPLPFGLILKWSERVRPEEAIAMQMARSAGMPTPKMLCYGEHPKALFKYSILMTRLPGFEMCQGDGEFDPENEQPWFDELKLCVNAMRQWKSPYDNSVCSALGTSISSQRVPRHAMGPFKSEKEMNDYLLSAASRDGFDSSE